jgi:putative addiction module killer protein
MRASVGENLHFQILKTTEFENWFMCQNNVIKDLISARLLKIAIYGHFGTIHCFDDMIELKWKSGLRVYTARLGKKIIVVLGAGNKNGQNKDIQKAKNLLKKIKVDNTFTA